jgi:hypothetical protein
MKYIGAILLVAVSVLFFGCNAVQTPYSSSSNQQSAIKTDSRPAWFYTPNQNDKIGGVGICGMHIKGSSAQRELAISRAIDEIARQLGVKVSNILKTSSTSSDTGHSASLESYSIHTVEGKTVTATIAGAWNDPATDELYIWMLTTQK